MYLIKKTGLFEKSFRRIRNSGTKETVFKDLGLVINLLADGKNLPISYKDHKLGGEFSDCRECHIKGDLQGHCFADILVFEKDFSLTDVYGADEAFVTGTFAGVVPVVELDGRKIGEDGNAVPGKMTHRLRKLYLDLIDRECP